MRTAALILPVLALSTALAPAQEGSVAVRAGKVLTGTGQVIENGTVVVEGGRIVAVGGPDLEVPFDTLLREYPDGVLFTGFAEAHTSSGVDRANENVPVAPFLDVRDSIDPVSFFYENELRGGVTALGVIPGNNCVIGGQGRVLAPAGMTVEEMTLSSYMGMKVAIGPKFGWSRSAQLAELREAETALVEALKRTGQTLLDKEQASADARRAGEEQPGPAEDHDDLDSAGGFIQFGEDFPGKALISEEDVDEIQRGLVRILNGDERLWLSCPGPTDVMHGLDWARDHGLLEQCVFVVSSAAHEAADLLAESGRPVALVGGLFHVENDPVTGKEKRTFAPTVLAEAGVTFAIGSEKGRMGPDRLAYQAATCVREGMSREQALALVTTAPAVLWGQEGQLGVLAKGALGNMVLLDGDPLAISSKVLKVWVKGREVYDRDQDERLQGLLEGGVK